MSYVDTVADTWNGYLGDTIFYDTTECTPCDSVLKRVIRVFDDSECSGDCDDSINLWVTPHKYWFAGTPYATVGNPHAEETPHVFAGNDYDDWGIQVGNRAMDTILNPIYAQADFNIDSIWFLKIIEVDSNTGTRDSFYTWFDTGWSSYDAYKAGQVDTIPDTGWAGDAGNSYFLELRTHPDGLEEQVGDTVFVQIFDTVHHNESPQIVNYLSDVEIFFDEESYLWLAIRPSWKPNLRGVDIGSGDEDSKWSIYVAKSTSGLDWTNNFTKIVHPKSGSFNFLSPAITLGNSGEYWMWTTHNYSGTHDSFLVRYSATKPDTIWNYDGACTQTNNIGGDASAYPFHYDVILRGFDELIMLAYTAGATTDGIEIGYSHDAGTTWTWKGDNLLDEGTDTWDSMLYKPTGFMIDDGASSRIGMFYGVQVGKDHSNGHRVGYTEIEFKEGYESADNTVRSEIRDTAWEAAGNQYVPFLFVHGNNTTPSDSVTLLLEGRDAGATEGWLFCDSNSSDAAADQVDTVLLSTTLPWGVEAGDSLIVVYKTSSATTTTSKIDNMAIFLNDSGTATWSDATDRAATARTRLQLDLSADANFDPGDHLTLQVIFEGDADAFLKVLNAYLVCDN
jgi:hypothetical protein